MTIRTFFVQGIGDLIKFFESKCPGFGRHLANSHHQARCQSFDPTDVFEVLAIQYLLDFVRFFFVQVSQKLLLVSHIIA